MGPKNMDVLEVYGVRANHHHANCRETTYASSSRDNETTVQGKLTKAANTVQIRRLIAAIEDVLRAHAPSISLILFTLRSFLLGFSVVILTSMLEHYLEKRSL